MSIEKQTYINFNSDSETDSASYKNRVNNLYTYRINQSNFLYNHGFSPISDYKKFITLKALDSSNVDVVSSEKMPQASSDEASGAVDATTANNITAAVENLQAKQFVQLFLDKYMSPTGSDIIYRLGDVTGVKAFAYNPNSSNKVLYDDAQAYAQYDEYGRIDTAINLRTKVDIPGVGSRIYYYWRRTTYKCLRRYRAWYQLGFHWYYKNVNTYIWSLGQYGIYDIPRTTEYYTNWFFPPYRKDVYSDGATLKDINIDLAVKRRTWDSKNKKWIYPKEYSDVQDTTFDTEQLLSMRTNPTYRSAAYKAVNDNISLLQNIFEQSCGIVSTYLTEWDLSIYIQEGLLEDKNDKYPTYMSLLYRITKDNPSSYHDSKALVYGALNSAVSKTPYLGYKSNDSYFTPYNYPLSTYWWPYDDIDRGDGLGTFYNTALKKYNSRNFSGRSFKDKVSLYDEIGAAYSGWKNWKDIKYWKLFYTTDDDGMSSIDILHSMIETDELEFADSMDSSNNESVDGLITQIINALYADDDELGYAPDEWDEKVRIDAVYYNLMHYKKNTKTGLGELAYYTTKKYDDSTYSKKYDANGNSLDNNSQSLSIDSSDIRILGCRIPGSGLLKLFLKKGSIKDAAMKLAKKNGSGYSSASSAAGSNIVNDIPVLRSTSNTNDSNTGNNNDSNSSDSDNSSSVSYVAEKNENSTYSRQDGVSQWSPPIYGGPHGKYYSPKTVQAYFEDDNKFLRNVPRYGNLSFNDSSSISAYDKYTGRESYYSATGNGKIQESISDRSPSRSISMLMNGHYDYTTQRVWSRAREYRTFYNYKPEYYNGHTIYYTDSGRYWSSYYYGSYTYYNWVNSSESYYFWWNGWGDNITKYYTSRNGNYYGYYNYDNYEYEYYGHKNGSKRSWYLYSWDNYRNYSGNPVYFHKDYIGYRRYNYNNYYNNYYWYNNAYQLGVYILRPYWVGYTYEWAYRYVNRPLMHSNTSALWNINRGYTRSYTMRTQYIYNYWWNPWSWWWNFIWGFSYRYSRLSSYTVIDAGPKECHWRLTFPGSGLSKYRYFVSEGHSVPEVRQVEEQNYMDFICGNTEGSSSWHNVFFFANKGGWSDRFNNGPDLIFKAATKTSSYSFTYNYWVRVCYRRHRCGSCRHYRMEKRTAVGQAYYIEVNLDDVGKNSIIYSGIKGTPWSNLSNTIYSGNKQEMINDIPPDYSRINAYSTPDSFMESASSSPYNYMQQWGGYVQNAGEIGFHGWGYTAAIPGFILSTEGVSGFEDANDYINYNRFNSKYTPISNLQIPFWRLSGFYSPDIIRQSNEFMYSTYGVRTYSRCYPDWALVETFRRIYSTSTFYKYVENDLSYINPCLIYNDVQLRALAKIVVHQKAWLEQAKNVYLNAVEFKEVKTIIEKTVDKNILSHTLPDIDGAPNKSRNVESCLYHPWIELAYSYFSDNSGNGKKSLMNAFNDKIGYLKSFLETICNSSNDLLSKTANNWSLNDFETAINATNTLRKNYLGDTTIEEYMYAYLNVLYEYRKYFINKRCNKVDGTYWILRELEGAIPLVNKNIEKPQSALASGALSIGSNTAGVHQYSVAYYMLNNSIYDKFSAIIDETKSLSKDRVMKIYIKIIYGTVDKAQAYLDAVKAKTDTVDTQRYIYIPSTGKYAELPYDDVYQYLSKEYLSNEAVKVYNTKVDSSLKKEEADIDTCIFNIKWANKSFDYKNGNLSSLTIKNYPYIYKESDETPDIKFDVVTGVDPSKLVDMKQTISSSTDADAFDIICTIQKKDDFWVVTIPLSEMPRKSGYLTNLKIKSYRENNNSSEVYLNYPASVSGVFGYMLYPITEKQANTMPGIGMDMTTLTDTMAKAYASDVTNNISVTKTSLDTTKYKTAT